ncbi:phosphatase PAP2 family protein [Hugenholtzia roseola]|uniref:phosphatase PAP2 family protein n=1 Tax=Hugenholtzia roseola TaxID=1002 RepID=UPI0003F57F9F|nr:phosphatase PAP2 family protein [Hugenholtzia roseola]
MTYDLLLELSTSLFPTLDRLDKDLFLWLHHQRLPLLEGLIWEMTHRKIWTPLFALSLLMLWLRYRSQFWLPLIGIALSIALADQIASSLFKPFFERLRPSHSPDLEGLVYFYQGYKGGKYGFVSSHASTSFGTAFFIFLLFKNPTDRLIALSKSYTNLWLGSLFLLWAAIFSYTRIYLGVHYPADILGGAIVGLLSAYLIYLLYQKATSYWLDFQQSRQKLKKN